MSCVITVEKISCNRCGYYDTADKFLEASKDKLEKNGSIYAGAVCPICGNLSELDFDPDNKIPQK